MNNTPTTRLTAVLRRLPTLAAAFVAVATLAAPPARAAAEPAALTIQFTSANATRYRTTTAGDFEVFYREAGDPAKPTVLLLHGFPTSSHMFRELIPLLADRYHVIAPDLPGFGRTRPLAGASPAPTFDVLGDTIAAFTAKLGLTRYAVYVQDYGAPVAWRLALAHPEQIAAIVTQNGNAYEAGLNPDAWKPITTYWQEPTPANREALRGFLKAETTAWQYTVGATEPDRVSPDNWVVDQTYLDRPGNAEIQLDLFRDYQSNLALYPALHAYFRASKPPLLAVWGARDPFFIPAGAEAFRADLPAAEIHLLEAGHFALETHLVEIAGLIRDFLARTLPAAR